MIISEMSDDQRSSPERTFWGIKVLPGKPVTVTLPCNSFKSLHISQATLENKSGDNDRSLVSVNYNNASDILICSLKVCQCDMANLKLDFHGPQDIVFSLSGSRGVHLAGYLYDYIPSPTNLVAPPFMDNGGRGIQQKESVLSIKIPGLGTADIVGEAVKEKGGTSFSFKILLPGLAESLNQIPVSLEHQLVAQSAAIIKEAIEKALVNQHLIQEEKQPGKKEKSEKGKNKCLPIAPETDHGDNDEGSKNRKRKKSNKPLPITDEVECENNGRSSVRRQLDYVLPAKEVQPADRIEEESEKKRKKKREKKQLPEVDGAEREHVEGEKKRKKKREKKQLPEGDGAEGDIVEGSTKRDTPQMSVLESKEDKKMKRRQRRRHEQKEKKELEEPIDEDDQNSENETREWKMANKHLLIAYEIEGQNNASEKKRKRKEGNKHLPTVEAIDANDYGSEEGRKHKVENTLSIIAADNDGDTNEGSSVRRKLDYVLPVVKEVQSLDSNDKESEKKRKKKREKKNLSKVDGAEGDNVEG